MTEPDWKTRFWIAVSIATAGWVLLASVWFESVFKPCKSWHNMKTDTNEMKGLQNEIQHDNGWQVSLTNFNLPYPVVSMTVEVCKICGMPTALKTHSKP